MTDEFIYFMCQLYKDETTLTSEILTVSNALAGKKTWKSAVSFSVEFYQAWKTLNTYQIHQKVLEDPMTTKEFLANHGIETLPTGATTLSHPARLFVRDSNTGVPADDLMNRNDLDYFKNFPAMTSLVLEGLQEGNKGNPWSKRGDAVEQSIPALNATQAMNVVRALQYRIFGDAGVTRGGLRRSTVDYFKACAVVDAIADEIVECRKRSRSEDGADTSGPDLQLDAYDLAHDTPGTAKSAGSIRKEDVEIVIVRPNIEHYMLGIILGLGGNDLGNTLWGQTELSVYDDSMHGVWGMSYKYHERAIVFNEKNLIRLWDVAYDGYIGGKDDTYVKWTDVGDCEKFRHSTMDVTENYRGQSMMVMAFVHSDTAAQEQHLKRNWPSPIVFYDSVQDSEGSTLLPADQDNLHMIDASEFRVFNNPLYASSYSTYHQLMPNFKSLTLVRKNAGQSAVDQETPSEMLAFQGTMRVRTKGGMGYTEILGSGHHGPDYVGIASVRDGKGQKVAAAQPVLHRLI
jgi:hypothetical protein